MKMTNLLCLLILVTSGILLGFAVKFYFWVKKQCPGNEKMIEISSFIKEGTRSYLKQQYKVVLRVFIVLTVCILVLSRFDLQDPITAVAIITGGFFSGLAGFFGTKISTIANTRVANAAKNSLNSALKIAIRAGAVLGLVTTGLILFDIAFWYIILDFFIENPDKSIKLIYIAAIMLTFELGASINALFARVGGGIFTKAADVGADLVGKIEAGIPEDDPRNPAVIADNVGDNVGDIAGMGADLYESYAGSILGTMLLAVYAFKDSNLQEAAFFAPLLIASLGGIFSLIGIFFIKTKENANAEDLIKSLRKGTMIPSILIAISVFPLFNYLEMENWIRLSLAVINGLVAGNLIGMSTEYFTSHTHRPTQKVAEAAKTGHATVIIAGLSIGQLSTVIPVLIIAGSTLVAFYLGSGNLTILTGAEHMFGAYAVGLSAVGMLSTLPITLAADAFGPIVDNAGGIAEMAKLDESVRKKTDMLDATGNTTAATGKGYSIGSAAQTAIVLLICTVIEYQTYLLKNGVETLSGLSLKNAYPLDIVNVLGTNPIMPTVIAGIFIGSMMVFWFSGIIMGSVNKVAMLMVNEVRRQFKEIPGIMTGKGKPDYAKCVTIATVGAQKEMAKPVLITIITTLLVLYFLKLPGTLGCLIGLIGTGLPMAIFKSNAGGTWDNAKKYIEEGNFGGKGSEAHKAAVTGDTVGDPCKDTVGPSINICIKAVNLIALVFIAFAV